MIWGDGSTILNHDHILHLIQCIYDPTFYYSSAEIKVKGYVSALVESLTFTSLGDAVQKKLSSWLMWKPGESVKIR